MSSSTRFLTGITTTGTPHLGNYVGAIRPAVQASRKPGSEHFYFLADYHALIKCDDPERIQRSTLEIAACWLAAGLDTRHVVFYRQSDVPEIPELTWLLTCVTGKGMLNRAHAYKAAVDKNMASGHDADAEVTAGLFMYPVLMAADILLFKANQVPVGRDQVQHIEMARDIASSFNHLYGEHLTLPEALVDESVATLPGLDGRKMSKSYDNVIALFGSREQMRKQIFSIVTDSRAPGEPKDADSSALFKIYQAFATEAETATLRADFAQGIGWADAKAQVFERIDCEIAPMRARYDHFMADPDAVETLLAEGAGRARGLAAPVLSELRHAAGLRKLTGSQHPNGPKRGVTRPQTPEFKQYRDSDGKFYFKLVDSDGMLLALSEGFESPREAGQLIAQVKAGDPQAQQRLMGWWQSDRQAQALLASLAQAHSISSTPH